MQQYQTNQCTKGHSFLIVGKRYNILLCAYAGTITDPKSIDQWTIVLKKTNKMTYLLLHSYTNPSINCKRNCLQNSTIFHRVVEDLFQSRHASPVFLEHRRGRRPPIRPAAAAGRAAEA